MNRPVFCIRSGVALVAWASVLGGFELVGWDVAEFAASVPASVHLQRGGKAILRTLLEKLEPQAAHRRRKTAFRAPAAQWLRGPLAQTLERQVECGLVFEQGWFDRSAVRTAAREHTNGSDRSQILWPLLALGLWLDEFAGGNRS